MALCMIPVLITIWEICGRICSKRLKPFLPEMITILERHGELELEETVKTQLMKMSRATIDRNLKSARFEHRKGLSTTKPGTLLKKAIPIRIFTPWEDEKPGFLEADLVAHCGETTQGQYLNTLTCTDIATGWTECLALPNKTQIAVFHAVQVLRQQLPFPLLGLDSDNGSEFINPNGRVWMPGKAALPGRDPSRSFQSGMLRNHLVTMDNKLSCQTRFTPTGAATPGMTRSASWS